MSALDDIRACQARGDIRGAVSFLSRFFAEELDRVERELYAVPRPIRRLCAWIARFR